MAETKLLMANKARLHPQVEALLSGVLRPNPGAPPLSVESIRAASLKVTELLVGPGEPVARTWDTVADTPHGPIALRWYQPSDALNKPLADALLVYVHGGGWVTGTLDTYDPLCRSLALRSGFHVVNVDYSLSPEALHPQAVLEVAAILQQAKQLARESGLEIRTLATAGDSAGGHLIAAAMHYLAATGQPLPDAAAFLYPITEASCATPSYTRFAEGFALTAERMRWYWRRYLGEDLDLRDDRTSDRLRDPLLSPLYSPHLQEFPPSLVVTAENDVLHDEGAAFAERLRTLSVPVEHLDVPGQIHGFLRYRKVLTNPVVGSDTIADRIGEFLRRQSQSQPF